jgi:hypothetical protein
MRTTVVALGLAALFSSFGSLGCSVGEGEGYVRSNHLTVPECWHGSFDLQPDFFATVPYRETQQIRIQHGSDLQEVSDGVSILVNDVSFIRQDMLDQPLKVGLAPELWNDFNPGAVTGTAPLVTLAFYLQFSCHNQNAILYAVDGTIVFQQLFSGDPNESEGAEKLTEAFFDVSVADPRDALPATTIVPEDKVSNLYGYFKFHFQRGRPGQPFP